MATVRVSVGSWQQMWRLQERLEGACTPNQYSMDIIMDNLEGDDLEEVQSIIAGLRDERDTTVEEIE